MRTQPCAVTLFALLLVSLPMRAEDPPWVQIAQLYGSDINANDAFGETLALDGDTLVVGAFRKDNERGAVYVFERSPGAPTEWLQTKKLSPIPGDDDFGKVVHIGADTIFVHALPRAGGGAIYVYGRDVGGTGEWGLAARIAVKQGGVGDIDGDTLAAGDSGADPDGKLDAGAVRMFHRGPAGPADWHYFETLTASDAHAQDHFGQEIALSGESMVIGAPQVRDQGINSGAAYIFERDETGVWSEVVKLLRPDGSESDHFGSVVDLDGETALIAGDAGNGGRDAAFVFERDRSGTWAEAKKLVPPPDRGANFGSAAALSGDVAVVAMPYYGIPEGDVGAALIYERHQGGVEEWGEVARVLAADPQNLDEFGRRVAIDGNTLVVGARSDDDRGTDAGTVYLFSRTAPLLSVTGYCPGKLALSAIGVTPLGQVVLLAGKSEGTTIIPSGPCAGTEVGLDAPKVIFAGTATSGGDLAVDAVFDPGRCGRYLQSVDIATCQTSAVVELR